MIHLPEEFKIVQGTSPVTTNGGVTSDWISLKTAKTAWVIVSLTQAVGHATAISINQGTTVAGGGTTPITNVVPIWANEDTDTSDTLVRQTDAVNYSVTNDVKDKQIIFKIDPALLNVAGGFDCITCIASDSSQATNFIQVTYVIETAYPDVTPPAAITN